MAMFAAVVLVGVLWEIGFFEAKACETGALLMPDGNGDYRLATYEEAMAAGWHLGVLRSNVVRRQTGLDEPPASALTGENACLPRQRLRRPARRCW